MRKLLTAALLALGLAAPASAQQIPQPLEFAYVSGDPGRLGIWTGALLGPYVQGFEVNVAGDTLYILHQVDSSPADNTQAVLSRTAVYIGGGGGADGVVTGGSLSGTTLTLTRSIGAPVTIQLTGLGGGMGADGVVQSGQLNGQNLVLTISDGSTVTVNLSGFTTNAEVQATVSTVVNAATPPIVSDSLNALRAQIPAQRYFSIPENGVAGASTNILLTTGENLQSLTHGMYFFFRAEQENGPLTTINVDQTGSLPVLRANATFVDERIPQGQFQNGTPVLVWFDAEIGNPYPNGAFHLAGVRVGDASFRNVGTTQGEIPVLGIGDVLPNSVIPPGVGGGINIVFQAGAPDDVTGANGDWALDTLQGAWYQKNAGTWTERYEGAIIQPDPGTGGLLLRDAGASDVGRLAVEGLNLRVGRIDPSHENPPTASFAEYTAAGFRGIHGLCPDIPDPQLNDRCFSELNRLWYRYGGSSWSSLSAAPARWRGAYQTEQEALVHLRGVNDVVWWNGSSIMHRVTAFTAGTPAYEWGIPSELQEALNRRPFDGVAALPGSPAFDEKLLFERIVGTDTTIVTRTVNALRQDIRPTVANGDASVEVEGASRLVFTGNGVTVAENGTTATMTITGTGGGGGSTVAANQNVNPAGLADLVQITIDGTSYNVSRDDLNHLTFRSSLPDATTNHSPEIVFLTHEYSEGNRQDAQLVLDFVGGVGAYSDGTIAGAAGYVSQRSPADRILGTGTAANYDVRSVQSTDREWLEDQAQIRINGTEYQLGNLIEESGPVEIYAKNIVGDPADNLTSDTLTINFRTAELDWWYTDGASVQYKAGLYELADGAYWKLIRDGEHHVDGIGSPPGRPDSPTQEYINDLGQVWNAQDFVTITTTENSLQRSPITSGYFVEDAPDYTTLLNNGNGSFSREADGQFAQIRGTQGVDGLTWTSVWQWIINNVPDGDNAQTRAFVASTWLGQYTSLAAVADVVAEELDVDETFVRFVYYFGIIGDLDVYEVTNFTRGTVTRQDSLVWGPRQATVEDVPEIIENRYILQVPGDGRPQEEPGPYSLAVNELGEVFASSELHIDLTAASTWDATDLATVTWAKWHGASDRPGEIPATDVCGFEYASHGQGFFEYRDANQSYQTGTWEDVLACFAANTGAQTGAPANLVEGTTASVFLDPTHHSFETDSAAAVFVQGLRLANAITTSTPYVYLLGTHGLPGTWTLRLVQPGGYTVGTATVSDRPTWGDPLGGPAQPWLVLTRAEYDALTTKDPNTLYFVIEPGG